MQDRIFALFKTEQLEILSPLTIPYPLSLSKTKIKNFVNIPLKLSVKKQACKPKIYANSKLQPA